MTTPRQRPATATVQRGAVQNDSNNDKNNAPAAEAEGSTNVAADAVASVHKSDGGDAVGVVPRHAVRASPSPTGGRMSSSYRC